MFSRTKTPTNSTTAATSSSPPAPQPAKTSKDLLIVGVDFGTTYSGVAVVHSAKPDDVDIITTWPGGNGITSDKVPTEIAYVRPASKDSTPLTTNSISTITNGIASLDTSSSTTKEKIKWGFQFRPEEARVRCIKLFLDRNQKLPHFVSPIETAQKLREYGKTVHDAVSDYLTMIYQHTMEDLYKRYGESYVKETPAEFVLTVPAVWSDAAKDATLKAAERAGMGSQNAIKLISEPEAAAVYTLRAVQPNTLRVGDNFIVCDAGGGTVDLIAYKILQLSPLRVEESAVGTGGLCGSAFLNYRFEDHVKSRIGEERYKHIKVKKPKTWNMGLKYFEEWVKRNFNEDEDQEINAPFPGLADDEEAGIDSGFLIMTTEQIKSIFDPVIREVIELVEGQVDTIRKKGGHVGGIILVGGFGQCNYLYKKMKRHFNTAPPPPYSERPTHVTGSVESGAVEVLHPMHSWTAVVRGAVLRGLEGSMVVSRKSRWHYGTSYATVFREGEHDLADRYWSPLWERWMVSDRMQWHIHKGQQISDATPIAFHYTRNFRPNQSLVVEDDLIASDLDIPPESYKSEGLINVCTLTTDLNAVPKSLFTRLTTTKGVVFENLDFTLEMRVGNELTFELKVDGVRYGAVDVNFH